jgi:hypothetical protein
MNKQKIVKGFIIGTMVSLYAIVSLISTIHVIDFFDLSNPHWLSISLAIAFEVGAAASLASLIVLDKTSKGLVWFLFFLLTGMQMMGNTYYAFTNLENFQDWVDLFGLTEEEPIFQKRILSLISGGILPVVALGFIKSLVDYMKPDDEEDPTKEYADVQVDNEEDDYPDPNESLREAANKYKEDSEVKEVYEVKEYIIKNEDGTEAVTQEEVIPERLKDRGDWVDEKEPKVRDQFGGLSTKMENDIEIPKVEPDDSISSGETIGSPIDKKEKKKNSY